MEKFLQLFRQTFVYGIATVFPRVISVILVRIHTDKSVLSEVSEFGTLSLIFSYVILFNVILSYGLETSFFRFSEMWSQISIGIIEKSGLSMYTLLILLIASKFPKSSFFQNLVSLISKN